MLQTQHSRRCCFSANRHPGEGRTEREGHGTSEGRPRRVSEANYPVQVRRAKHT